MRKLIILFLFLLFIISCKKDKLEGDKTVFVGRWKWVYTMKSVRECDSGNTSTYILNPDTENTNYSIEFNKKGCVTFFVNNEETDKYRTVFSSNGWREHDNPNYFGYTYFGFHLNNKSENSFSGYIKSDTLIELGFWFPYKITGNDCITYKSYFVKE